ncbi:hypothetical protein ACOMHN_057300 [Nucella lapillus]
MNVNLSLGGWGKGEEEGERMQTLNQSEKDATGPLITLFVPLLMFATGVLGNLVALALLWRSRRDHSRSVFYRLVSGLALTDLLGILATSPVTILVYSKDRQWVGGQAVCDYFSFMMIFSGLATVLVVGCLAVERFLAILHPYTYERSVTPSRANCTLGIVWVVSAFISCLPLMEVGSNVLHWPGTWCFFDFYSHHPVDNVFAFFFAFIGLLVIVATAVCNFAVMIILLRMRRISQNIGKSREGRTLNMTSEMQMIFFLAGIILVFAACYSPLMIRIVLNVTGAVARDEQWDLLAIRLASVNQILDPWVYLLFRRRLAAILYSACKSVSPLHTLSSLKALRGTPELARGSSLKNVTGLRFVPASNGVDSSQVVQTPCQTDSPAFPELTDRGEDGHVKEEDLRGSKDLRELPPVVSSSEDPQDESKDDSCLVSVEADDARFGNVAVVLMKQGEGDDSNGCSLLLNEDSLGDSYDFNLGPGGRFRKTSCENPALCLEGEDWFTAVTGNAETKSQGKVRRASQPVLRNTCTRLSAPRKKKNSLGHSENSALDIGILRGINFRNKPLTKQDCKTDESSHPGCDTDLKVRGTMNLLNVSWGIPSTNSQTSTPAKSSQCQSAVAKLTTSASWPVICRHGNQTVTKVDSEEEAEVVNCLPVLKTRHSDLESDCFPLLKNNGNSQVESPCEQCQGFSNTPIYV